MEEESKLKTLRHCEKERTSTCLFADFVAKTSIDAFHNIVNKEEENNEEIKEIKQTLSTSQTVIASVLALIEDKLLVLSLGGSNWENEKRKNNI